MPNRSMVIAQSAKVEKVVNLLINIRIYIMHIQPINSLNKAIYSIHSHYIIVLLLLLPLLDNKHKQYPILVGMRFISTLWLFLTKIIGISLTYILPWERFTFQCYVIICIDILILIY